MTRESDHLTPPTAPPAPAGPVDRSPDSPSRPTRPQPLFPIAIGMIAGISADHYMPMPIVVAYALIIIAALFGFARQARSLLIRMRIRHPDPRRLVAAAVISAFALGVVRHAIAERYFAADDVSRFASDSPMIVTVTGRIASAPRIVEPDPAVPLAYPKPPRTLFVLDLDTIDGVVGPLPASGRLPVTIKEPMLGLSQECRVRVTGWLRRFRPPQNPGAYDWSAHFARQNIHLALSTDHAAAVSIIEPAPTGTATQFINGARSRLRRYLTDTAFPNDDENAGVAAAMVLGQRSVVSDALNDAFLRTGNVHFLAASGMHVGWLALVAWCLARLLGLHYRRAAPFVAGVIVAFVLIAEPRPSILRAGIVGLLACFVIFARGRHHPANALSLAAIILLLIDPNDLFTPGFQLTFVATLGIFQFFPVVSNALAEWISLRLRVTAIGRLFVVEAADQTLLEAHIADHDPIRDRLPGWGYRVVRVAALALTLAFSEWLLTAPLACFHFNTFAPWGAVGTFLVAPFAMLSATVGFMTVLAGVTFPTLGRLLGPVLHGLVTMMTAVVGLLARLPGSLVDGRSPSLLWTLAVYAFLWAWSAKPVVRGAWRAWPARFVGLSLVAWWWIAPIVQHQPDGALRVWMLAIGDGSATIIELPNGRSLLFDFGTRSGFDAAVVGRDFLKHRRIESIDAAFVTHANFDHYGAIEPISRTVPIRRLIVNDQFTASAVNGSPAARFLQSIRDAGIPIHETSGATTFDFCPDVRIASIWPPARSVVTIPTDNDASTVLRIEYEGRSILLTGDIAEVAMGSLISENRTGDGLTLKADAVALPHHGSVVANTRAFIDAVDPMVAVRSSGQRRQLTINGIETLVGPMRSYFNTADDGCVLLTIQNGALTAKRVMFND